MESVFVLSKTIWPALRTAKPFTRSISSASKRGNLSAFETLKNDTPKFAVAQKCRLQPKTSSRMMFKQFHKSSEREGIYDYQKRILNNDKQSVNTASVSVWMKRFNHSVNDSTVANNSAMLKDQSALQIRRPARKKVPKLSEEAKTVQLDNIVAYAVAEEIKLQQLENYLIKQGLYNIGKLPLDVTDALHVRGKYNIEQKPKEIFVFEDGSVVFWCVPELERNAFLNILAKFVEGPYISSLILFEREEMDFTCVSNGKTSLAGDIIQLRESDPDNQHRLLEIYTFSNALSQSVKLAIWENSLNKFVTSIERVTEELRHGHKISMTRKEILMKSGELFSLRHLINLSSELLDTPDFYWDREQLEPLYLSLYYYLNIARRTRVINEKLSHCCELTELVSSHLNDTHHTRLEVMIIVLIMVEVVFECIHYAERYFDHQVSTGKTAGVPYLTQRETETSQP
ncbi:unnamed protein product [Lymnaea stagnalis]|uniref:DUF155 domain-containing protein n=1 Tax=Lymnaea stagnalis TaxID=6523 RepID=A0AAV2IGS5_LYMST